MKRKYIPIGLMLTIVSFNLMSGPHRIRFEGDTILKEGTEATYTLSVTNTWDKDFDELDISVIGFGDSGLECCSSSSDKLKIFENTLFEPGSLEAFCEHLGVGETVTMSFTAKGTRLKKPGDVHSITLTINVNPGNVRKGTIRKQISIFKAE